MIKKYLLIFLVALFLFGGINFKVKAISSLADKLQGLILLQVEKHGEAWYINPENQERCYMGKPANALAIIQKFGLGISNDNLDKIPIGIINIGRIDTDSDGIDDELEKVIGTDIYNKDTDNDGYDDKIEIDNQYNPNGSGKINIDENLISKNLGRFLIQVENNGEAWYLYPKDHKRYYVGKPIDALIIMQKLGLGISDANLSKIKEYKKIVDNKINENSDSVLQKASKAIIKGDIEGTLKYFTPETGKRARYSLEHFDDRGRLNFGDILSRATLDSCDGNTAEYTSKVYFSLGGYETGLKIILQKQDGEWLISSI